MDTEVAIPVSRRSSAGLHRDVSQRKRAQCAKRKRIINSKIEKLTVPTSQLLTWF